MLKCQYQIGRDKAQENNFRYDHRRHLHQVRGEFSGAFFAAITDSALNHTFGADRFAAVSATKSGISMIVAHKQVT